MGRIRGQIQGLFGGAPGSPGRLQINPEPIKSGIQGSHRERIIKFGRKKDFAIRVYERDDNILRCYCVNYQTILMSRRFLV